MKKIPNYIDGEWVAPAGGGYLDNREPATGRVYSRVPDSDQADVDQAVAAARRAAPGWSGTPAATRSRILLDVAARIESDLERLAGIESTDTGSRA